MKALELTFQDSAQNCSSWLSSLGGRAGLLVVPLLPPEFEDGQPAAIRRSRSCILPLYEGTYKCHIGITPPTGPHLVAPWEMRRTVVPYEAAACRAHRSTVPAHTSYICSHVTATCLPSDTLMYTAGTRLAPNSPRGSLAKASSL